ncbi:MAG: hypothetical protein ABS948_17885 [Solibacillus sp.]
MFKKIISSLLGSKRSSSSSRCYSRRSNHYGHGHYKRSSSSSSRRYSRRSNHYGHGHYKRRNSSSS